MPSVLVWRSSNLTVHLKHLEGLLAHKFLSGIPRVWFIRPGGGAGGWECVVSKKLTLLLSLSFQFSLRALPSDAGAGTLLSSFGLANWLPVRAPPTGCKAGGGRREQLLLSASCGLPMCCGSCTASACCFILAAAAPSYSNSQIHFAVSQHFQHKLHCVPSPETPASWCWVPGPLSSETSVAEQLFLLEIWLAMCSPKWRDAQPTRMV